jgi:hypothetical protein
MSQRDYDDLRNAIAADAAARRNGSSPTAWPAPLAEEAFYGLPGRVVRTIEPHSESDPGGLLAQYLVAFGNVVGRHPYYLVEGTRHCANEYIAIVGETSKARKGTSWGRIRQVFERVDSGWTNDRTGGGLSTGEGLIWEVRDPVRKTVKVLDDKKKWTGDWVEELEDPGVDDKRLLAQEAELSRYFAVMSRAENTLSETLRKMWDEGSAAARAKTSRARCTAGHLSIVGHVPVDELRTGLTRTQAANGFANRFLWILVRRARELPFGGQLQEGQLQGLAADTSDVTRAATNIGQLTMDGSARELWADVYSRLSRGDPGMLGAILARAEAHVIRLALIYALTDGTDRISHAHLQAALAVWDYSARSAMFIFGDAIGDPTADDILRELRLRDGGMTRTEIRQLLGGSYQADRIQAALQLLRQHRLAYMLMEESGGRPTERWQAVKAEQTERQEEAHPEPSRVTAIDRSDTADPLVSRPNYHRRR